MARARAAPRLSPTPRPRSLPSFQVRNEKARRFLLNMRPKPASPLAHHFPRADPAALRLLARLLAFDPAARPTADEALADPYFAGLASPAREPAAAPVSKLAFEFERRKLTPDEVRELIYREILEYHPHLLADHLAAAAPPTFLYPSAVDAFRRQFAAAEGGAPHPASSHLGQAASLPRERVREFQSEAARAGPAPSLAGAAAAKAGADGRYAHAHADASAGAVLRSNSYAG